MERSFIILPLILLIALPVRGARVAGQMVATPTRATERLDLASALAAIEMAVEEKRQSLRVPGAALVIVKDDRIVLLKGFGLRDVERKLPVTPDTLFGIGSATKTFTALAAVISADEGKLSLHDSPKKFLPYFQLRDPEANANVTLRDLLSHRTGLQAYGNDKDWYGTKRSREEVIKIGMSSQPTARFREKGQYNNVMYIAVGEAIGKAHHSTWEAVIASRIFLPLGMTASNCTRRRTEQSADFAQGYDREGNAWDRDFNRDTAGGAGAINSTAREMGQWLRLMLGGGSLEGKRIVSTQGWQEMLTELAVVEESPYGLGMEKHYTSSGVAFYGHGGGIDGFGAYFGFVPTHKLGFAILANHFGNGGKLTVEVVTIVLDHLPPQN